MFCLWTFDSDDDCCDILSYGSSAHPTQRMICVVLARYFEILFVHITGHRDPAQPVSLYR